MVFNLKGWSSKTMMPFSYLSIMLFSDHFLSRLVSDDFHFRWLKIHFANFGHHKNLPNLVFKLVNTICNWSIAFLVKLLHSLILKKLINGFTVFRGHSRSLAVIRAHTRWISRLISVQFGQWPGANLFLENSKNFYPRIFLKKFLEKKLKKYKNYRHIIQNNQKI